MKCLFKKIFDLSKKISITCVSLLSCVFFSSWRVVFFARKMYKENANENCAKECYILGNGPALNDALNDFSARENVSLYVFNFFAKQDVYFQIKPDNYIFIDSNFWNDTHSALQDQDSLKQFYLSREILFNNLKKQIGR